MVLLPVAGAVGFVTLLTYMPSALQAVQDMSAGVSGLMMLAMTVPVLICPTLVHRYLSRREGTSPAGVSIVALYATVMTALISAAPGAAGRVEEIAAGQSGGADIYAAALHPVLAGIAALCALLLVAFVVLNRRASQLARTALVTTPEAPE